MLRRRASTSTRLQRPSSRRKEDKGQSTRQKTQSLVVSYPTACLLADPEFEFRPRLMVELVNRMARATWNGKVIAESEVTETVEGNVYFPESSLKREYFRPSSTTSTCPWKGQARYMSLLIDGQDNPDAAWYYPDPKPAARKIRGYVAFWRGVEIEK